MNIEERMRALENRQNVLEHIIKVIFSLFKNKIDKAVYIQIESALLTLTDFKKIVPKELEHDHH